MQNQNYANEQQTLSANRQFIFNAIKEQLLQEEKQKKLQKALEAQTQPVNTNAMQQKAFLETLQQSFLESLHNIISGKERLTPADFQRYSCAYQTDQYRTPSELDPKKMAEASAAELRALALLNFDQGKTLIFLCT